MTRKKDGGVAPAPRQVQARNSLRVEHLRLLAGSLSHGRENRARKRFSGALRLAGLHLEIILGVRIQVVDGDAVCLLPPRSFRFLVEVGWVAAIRDDGT